MATKSGRQRSLFGGTLPDPKDPRGRKRIAWDKQTAESVVLLAAREATQEAIAEAVGLSVKTLMRIYADEVASGAEVLRRAVFERQARQAIEKGSTPAARFVIAQLDKQDLEQIAYRPGRRAAAAPKVGKKEQRLIDAGEAVDGLYAPGPPPAQLVN